MQAIADAGSSILINRVFIITGRGANEGWKGGAQAQRPALRVSHLPVNPSLDRAGTMRNRVDDAHRSPHTSDCAEPGNRVNLLG